MSDTTTNSGSRPTHHAYHVRDYQTGGEKRSSWTNIGSVWTHPDGQGFNIRLHATPIDGHIVLRTVKEKKQSDEVDEEQG